MDIVGSLPPDGQQPPDDAVGGSGAGSAPQSAAEPEPAPGLKTGRLEARALAEHWPIEAEAREKIIARLVAIVTDPKSRRRDATAAARALVSAGGANLAGVSVAIRASEHEQLAARLVELERRLAERGVNPT